MWNGNGKIYNYKKKLQYEGKVLNGIKNGLGKEYDDTGELIIFDGEYSKGERKKGKEYRKGELRFEGEYKNGIRWNGKGKEFNYKYDGYKILIDFEGEYFEGKKWNGKIKDHSDDMIYYEGEILNGKKHGKGKEFFASGKIIYEGEYLNGERVDKEKKNTEE